MTENTLYSSGVPIIIIHIFLWISVDTMIILTVIQFLMRNKHNKITSINEIETTSLTNIPVNDIETVSLTNIPINDIGTTSLNNTSVDNISVNETESLNNTPVNDQSNVYFMIRLTSFIMGTCMFPLAITTIIYTMIPKWMVCSKCVLADSSWPKLSIIIPHVTQSLCFLLLSACILFWLTGLTIFTTKKDIIQIVSYGVSLMATTITGIIFILLGSYFPNGSCHQYKYVFQITGGFLITPCVIVMILFFWSIFNALFGGSNSRSTKNSTHILL